MTAMSRKELVWIQQTQLPFGRFIQTQVSANGLQQDLNQLFCTVITYPVYLLQETEEQDRISTFSSNLQKMLS